MKLILALVLCMAVLLAGAQKKEDSLRLLQQMGRLYDLNLSTAETDSMLEGIREYQEVYSDMHKVLPVNSLSYPFAYVPAPKNKKTETQPKINWTIPNNVSLPKNKNDLAFYSIPQLASLIRNRRITSVALTHFFLERLKKWNDSLKCVISYTEDIALAQARKMDAELNRGNYRGPLHGIPYGIKDLFAVKGTKTTWGSTPYKEQVIDENSFVFEQLEKAGAVLCAKLSLGALAFNDLWFGGRTNNPWNLRQGSSGSSAGSAAATAAGLLPFAIGTETWGSIVSPSARCGVTGLRPSFGSTARSGAMVLCWSLDKVGPICRSAEDAAIVFAALKGADEEDLSSVDYAFDWDKRKDVRKLRVAYAENYFRRLNKEAMEWKVLRKLDSLGIEAKPVIFPDSAIYPFDIIGTVLSAESAAAFDDLTRTDRDSLIERQDKNFWPNIFRTARFIPAVEYINANRHRSELNRKMQEFMKDYDVLIVPTFAGRQLAITNLTGNPAICLPIGFTPSGNPYSITFIGNLYDEVPILQVAKVFQDNTEYNKQRPPLVRD